MANQRELSRQTWEGNNTTDSINSGSFQRIADACEKMAVNHTELIAQRDRYKEWYEDEKVRTRNLYKRLDYTQRHVTRLKNQLKKIKQI